MTWRPARRPALGGIPVRFIHIGTVSLPSNPKILVPTLPLKGNVCVCVQKSRGSNVAMGGGRRCETLPGIDRQIRLFLLPSSFLTRSYRLLLLFPFLKNHSPPKTTMATQPTCGFYSPSSLPIQLAGQPNQPPPVWWSLKFVFSPGVAR